MWSSEQENASDEDSFVSCSDDDTEAQNGWAAHIKQPALQESPPLTSDMVMLTQQLLQAISAYAPWT